MIYRVCKATKCPCKSAFVTQPLPAQNFVYAPVQQQQQQQQQLQPQPQPQQVTYVAVPQQPQQTPLPNQAEIRYVSVSSIPPQAPNQPNYASGQLSLSPPAAVQVPAQRSIQYQPLVNSPPPATPVSYQYQPQQFVPVETPFMVQQPAYESQQCNCNCPRRLKNSFNRCNCNCNCQNCESRARLVRRSVDATEPRFEEDQEFSFGDPMTPSDVGYGEYSPYIREERSLVNDYEPAQVIIN